jgi:ATP-dependent Clp protease ATP-binding subunit ClpA
MFERFTGKARQVVIGAQEEARTLLHNYIGTEHILLGLFTVPDSIGARALRQLGMTREMVQSDIESMIGKGQESPSGHIPFTPRAKKVLELALREALQLNHNYIGTEHILLALVREGEGVAAQILGAHIEVIGNVRATVMTLLGGGREAAEKIGRRKATSAADEVVTAAEALAGGAPMGSHHLLEALVRAEGSMAAKALRALGVDPEALASTIDELDPEGTTDATPEEAAARKMELRVEDGEVRLVFRDEETLDLATKVTALTEGPIRGNGPISGAFVPLWTATNELLRTFLTSLQPEPEGEGKDVFGKASLMMRRVMRGRLQRRRPPEATG